MRIPLFETARLTLRELRPEDLEEVHQLLDIELGAVEFGSEGAKRIEARKQWLEWTVQSYEQLAALHQPPYGDRAIVLRSTGRFIGLCGLVPALGPFGQLPGFQAAAGRLERRFTPEVGLFYALSPTAQRNGYATEAVGALVDHAFRALNLARIVATTTYDNASSIGVMERLGMRIERNPFPDPPWFQVVGVLER